VSVDLYRSAEIADQFAEDIRTLVEHGGDASPWPRPVTRALCR
jgi:hypothetical protein